MRSLFYRLFLERFRDFAVYIIIMGVAIGGYAGLRFWLAEAAGLLRWSDRGQHAKRLNRTGLDIRSATH